VKAEIVGVGTEILLGQICNDNAQWMSERLAEIGVDVPHHQAVGDNLQRITDALRLAISRADVVLVTGGLGPTQDDITREGISAALGLPLERRHEIEEFLRERFRQFGRPMPEMNLQQADVPLGGRYILPDRGTAPGLAIETTDGKRLYAVAGVPAEMREMMTGTILPELAAIAGATIVSRTLRVVGIGESAVAERLDDLFLASANPSVAYLASSGETRVRLTAKAATAEDANRLIDPIAREVMERLGAAVFSVGGEDLAEVVGTLLVEREMTLATAESLTGGSLAARITMTPGASDSFLGSVVSYAVPAKVSILGVSEETLAGPGVVSEECAMEMAAGARGLFDADVAVGLTGAAGPESHDGAAPGTVCVGIAHADGTEARTLHAPGDREEVRKWSEQAALDMVRRHLLLLPAREGRSADVEGGVAAGGAASAAGS
jgi:nicotinamide-nucleotide amidase